MIIAQRPILKRDFLNESYRVVDTSDTSPNYFDITFFPDTIGGGKSIIKFKGNRNNLALYKKAEVEIIDARGNAVRTQIEPLVDRFNNYHAVVNVLDDVAEGYATVAFVGAASRDLSGNLLDISSYNNLGYNLIWTKRALIQPFERNNSEIIFNNAPDVTVAQIIAPARLNGALYQNQYTIVTSSTATISTSNFKGFDKKNSTSNQVVDINLVSTKINPNAAASTTNEVNTLVRQTHADIQGGYLLNDYKRFNTVIQSATSLFKTDHVGGFVEFYSSSYTLVPSIPTNAAFAKTNPYNKNITTEPQNLKSQLELWQSTVVRVENDRLAYLETPVQINIDVPTTRGTTPTTITHTYKQVLNFTGSLTFTANPSTIITSSIVSQSYIQFTFRDLNPIAGEVYKIKTYYKRSSTTQDWTLLNDQVVQPAEYLVDAAKPNQTTYAKSTTDFQLIGHFTTQSILADNWTLYNDTLTGFDTATINVTNYPLINSVNLQTTATYNKLLTTKFFQNYAEDQTHTIAADYLLQPYTKVEVYVNSEPLNANIITQDYLPKAFLNSKNLEKPTYVGDYNKFGKLIGTITNDTDRVKSYGRVTFDFQVDNNGLGRPLLRCKSTNAINTGSCYVSKINITPTKLSGFTPRIVQYALQAPADYQSILSESVDFKLEYCDYTGRQSEYITYLKDITLELAAEVPTNKCQAESLHSATILYQNYTGKLTPMYWTVCSSTQRNIGTIFTPSLLTYGSPQSRKFYPYFEHPISVPAGVNQYHPFKGWNILKPSMSISVGQTGSYTGSFNFVPNWTAGSPTAPINLSQGTITSSWHYVDAFIANYLNTSSAALGNALSLYSQSFTQSAASVIDSRSFGEGGGAGISYLHVSNSYYSFSVATTNAQRTEALKKRRLYWPTLSEFTSSYFNENGGIYNVKFKLKRYVTGSQQGSAYPIQTTKDFYPQTGSYLSVYIFDINKTYTQSTTGTRGWYPPSNNIAKIGHGYSSGSFVVPTLTWYDTATGYYYEEYDINLIQYGSPAQLVFEPSGDNGTYFGTIISDVQFCKVGITTDPRFIKPQAVQNIYAIPPQSQPYIPLR